MFRLILLDCITYFLVPGNDPAMTDGGHNSDRFRFSLMLIGNQFAISKDLVGFFNRWQLRGTFWCFIAINLEEENKTFLIFEILPGNDPAMTEGGHDSDLFRFNLMSSPVEVPTDLSSTMYNVSGTYDIRMKRRRTDSTSDTI